MTAIDPGLLTAAGTAPASTAPSAKDTNQLNQDTFLKLLVAQLKYQNPLSPTDSTAFLTQTAQFTTVSTLQQIEKDQQAIQQTNQLLAASGMVGRGVTYSTAGIAPATPVATTAITIGGNLPQDAPLGARVNVTTTAYDNAGDKIPLQLELTRTASGWSMQASSDGKTIGAPSMMTFDATGDRTSADFVLSQVNLDELPGTTGAWPPAGITLKMGSRTDTTRLGMGAGASTVTVRQQNGGDGRTLTGIVTGIKVTSNGPLLTIDGHDVPLSSVTEVHSPDS